MTNQILTFVVVEKVVGQKTTATSGTSLTFTTGGEQISFGFKVSPFDDGTREFAVGPGEAITFTLIAVTSPTTFAYQTFKGAGLDEGIVGSGDIDIVPPPP